MNSYNIEDLETEYFDLQTDIALIKAQMFEAKELAKAPNEKLDRTWYAKANWALKLKGVRYQQLARQIGKSNRQIKQSRAKEREALFVDACRSLVGKELYLKIWDLVEEWENGSQTSEDY